MGSNQGSDSHILQMEAQSHSATRPSWNLNADYLTSDLFGTAHESPQYSTSPCLFFHPFSPHPPPPQYFAALPPLFTPVPLVPLIFPSPSHSLKFPHLKLVQRKPARMGVPAPTGTGQLAYSLGTGSSGSRWSPHGARPGDGRMEKLEELEQGGR